MRLLYILGGYVFSFGLWLASWVNPKVRLMIEGRRETIDRLKRSLSPEQRMLWLHASSLGEFEQGRPLLESIKQTYPEWQIVLSFFSPSGYEVRKDYNGVDSVVYLPNDTPRAVSAFLDAVRPEIAIFVKYDLWPVMLGELKRRDVRTYLISAIFRADQLFFKPWGGWYLKLLHCFDRLYVQDQQSIELLASHGVHHVTIVGDTRFDRVEAIAQRAKEVQEVNYLRQTYRHVIVGGSLWGEEHKYLVCYAQKHSDVAIIMAPHEAPTPDLIEAHRVELGMAFALLSEVRSGKVDMNGVRCLMIDCFGLLSSIYRYADVAFVGGGFYRSIHNTIEAAVYGIPVAFGPKYDKFREAKLLIVEGGGFAVHSEAELHTCLDHLLSDRELWQSAGEASRRVVERELGATKKILNDLELG